jgi:hypothetical protein
MNLFKRCHRWITALQKRITFKIALSILCLAGCSAYFAPMLVKSYGYASSARSIAMAFTGPEGDRFIRTLRETGSVKIDGEVRTLPAELAPTLFAEDGSLTDLNFTMFLMLRDQVPTWGPQWLLQQPTTTWIFYGAVSALLLVGVWLELFIAGIYFSACTAAGVSLAWMFGSRDAMFAFAGIGLLLFTFVLLIKMVSLLLSAPNQVMSIAHTVVKEASRSRISLIFIIILLVMLPLLPFWLDVDAPLRHRVQTFISRSVGMTFALCACMTLVLACATVAFEIRDRQIWQIMTKPVSKFRYLMGKWLGVVVLNAVILTIAGMSTFLYIQYLRTTDVAEGLQGDLDRMAVREEVLTARTSDYPIYEPIPQDVLDQMVAETVANDPQNERYGNNLPDFIRRGIERRINRELDFTRRTVPPGRDGEPGSRTFVFGGLMDAFGGRSPLTLRYRLMLGDAEETDTYSVGFVFNQDMDTLQVREYVPTMSHFTLVPPDLVRPDGSLEVTIHNLYEQQPGKSIGRIYFEPDDFEVLYKVGGFEANFLRAMLVMLIKLGFLTGLAVCCATFLSFPVACLTSFTIFIAATLGPYLAWSLEYYVPAEANRVDWSNIGVAIQWIFEMGIRQIARLSVFLLEAFGQYRPTNDLVNGLVVSWGTVFGSFIRLAVIWSGLTLVLGWLILRKRQLAIYSGGQS